jgi:putative PIN family toxin of toxin-antitoxin system
MNSAVLDTNVLVAGLTSRNGASHQLLLGAIERRFALLASPPLWLEYEAVLKRAEIMRMHRLDHVDIDAFLDGLATVVRPVHFHYLWRPQLRDPKDEMVLETTMNGRADVLVTFNIADFRAAMMRFSPRLITPSAFLAELERS